MGHFGSEVQTDAVPCYTTKAVAGWPQFTKYPIVASARNPRTCGSPDMVQAYVYFIPPCKLNFSVLFSLSKCL